MARHLVIGGAGRTGRRVTAQLLDRGHQVRVLSRRPPSMQGIETVRGDLASLAAGDAALRDIAGIVVSVEPPYDAAGAETVLHRGVARLAAAAADQGNPVVLVSQIYVTRPEAYPQMAAVTEARARGEEALRASGADYAIVRPGWLHDGPVRGVRLTQGDTDDGRVSRDAVAAACVTALLTPVTGLSFEVFDGDEVLLEPGDWADRLSRLVPDRQAWAPDGR